MGISPRALAVDRVATSVEGDVRSALPRAVPATVVVPVVARSVASLQSCVVTANGAKARRALRPEERVRGRAKLRATTDIRVFG